MRPFRPCPEDFEEVYARVRSINGCARHYRTSFRKSRQWLGECGLKPYRPAERSRAEAPLNFPALARSRSIEALKLELRTGWRKITAYYEAAGIQKRPAHRPRRERATGTPTETALAHLRAWFPGAYDMGALYEQVTGSRFVVGRRRMSEGQMLELARAYGWQG